MSTATLKPLREFGPESAGTLMTLAEFDRAVFERGWRYELIHGVLIVSPTPLENERDPNDELGYLLRKYREEHPQGGALDATVPEQLIRTRRSRRVVDRAIWAGLGRQPRRRETPTVAVEFVSSGKRNRERDYEEKRDEYREIGIQEYWIIDRFARLMTVYSLRGSSYRRRVFTGKQVYTTALLPGFELPPAKLFALAERWQG